MNKRNILIAIVAFLIFAQFIRIDKTNPAVDPSATIDAVESVPDEVSSLLKLACYDCHSNESTYPWYTNVAPVSWWIKRHINNGRSSLNFSEWGSYTESKRAHKKEECVEFISKDWMPIFTYKLMHSESKLSEDQKAILANWFNS